MTRFEVFAAILNDIGTPISGRVLDLGCGDGALVKGAIDAGFDAYGCDFEGASFIKTKKTLKQMTDTGRLLPIDPDPYRLPYDDGTFDIVLSDQVFEHVQDYPETLAEIARVMKPRACGLHIFPSRTRLIEAHAFIPLGGVLQSRAWLALWAYLGIRNQYQRGLSANETVVRNWEYLSNFTNYLTTARLRAHFENHFSHVEFAERFFLRYSRRLKFLRFAPALYRALQARVVYAHK